MQEANRELGSKLKEKDAELTRLKRANKDLKRLGRTAAEERSVTREDVETVRLQLEAKDKEYEVNEFDSYRDCKLLNAGPDEETGGGGEEPQTADDGGDQEKAKPEEGAADCSGESCRAGATSQGLITILSVPDLLYQEKERQVHRLNIFPNRKKAKIKQSVSTGNLSTVGAGDFVLKLGTKLNLLRKQKEAFEVLEEGEEEIVSCAQQTSPEEQKNKKPLDLFSRSQR